MNDVVLCVPNDKGNKIFRLKSCMPSAFNEKLLELCDPEFMHLEFDIREADIDALSCLENKNKSKSNTNQFGIEILDSFYTMNNCTVKSIMHNRIKIKGDLSRMS